MSSIGFMGTYRRIKALPIKYEFKPRKILVSGEPESYTFPSEDTLVPAHGSVTFTFNLLGVRSTYSPPDEMCIYTELGTDVWFTCESESDLDNIEVGVSRVTALISLSRFTTTYGIKIYVRGVEVINLSPGTFSTDVEIEFRSGETVTVELYNDSDTDILVPADDARMRFTEVHLATISVRIKDLDKWGNVVLDNGNVVIKHVSLDTYVPTGVTLSRFDRSDEYIYFELTTTSVPSVGDLAVLSASTVVFNNDYFATMLIPLSGQIKFYIGLFESGSYVVIDENVQGNVKLGGIISVTAQYASGTIR